MVKWDSNGLVQQWSVGGNDTTSQMFCNSITTDSQDNIYICGSYYNTTNPVIVNNLSTVLTPASFVLPITTGISCFIIKFLTDGTSHSWTVVPINNGQAGNNIYITNDKLDNLYMFTASQFSGTSIPIYNFSINNAIGPLQPFGQPIIPSGSNQQKCLLVKWDSNGMPYSWTNLNIENTFSNAIALTINNDSDLYILYNQRALPTKPYFIGDMTRLDIPNDGKLFYRPYSNYYALIKILNDGQISIMPEIIYYLPAVTSITEFTVDLQTPNYCYRFEDVVSGTKTSINALSDALKTQYTFLWNGEWKLVN